MFYVKPLDVTWKRTGQGDLTTGGVSIRFVLILQLPYDYFYGAYKSELIRFHIIFFYFFLLKNAISISGSCLQKLKILCENELTVPHKSSCTTAANSSEIREKHTPIVKSRCLKDDDNSKLALDDLPKPKLDELEKSESVESEKIMNRTYPYLRIGFISCMTFMFAIANGLNFAYSNFVTKFAVNSNLSLNKSQGARLTAIYFGCSAVMKFITIGLLRIFKPIRLIIFNVII